MMGTMEGDQNSNVNSQRPQVFNNEAQQSGSGGVFMRKISNGVDQTSMDAQINGNQPGNQLEIAYNYTQYL